MLLFVALQVICLDKFFTGSKDNIAHLLDKASLARILQAEECRQPLCRCNSSVLLLLNREAGSSRRPPGSVLMSSAVWLLPPIAPASPFTHCSAGEL